METSTKGFNLIWWRTFPCLSCRVRVSASKHGRQRACRMGEAVSAICGFKGKGYNYRKTKVFGNQPFSSAEERRKLGCSDGIKCALSIMNQARRRAGFIRGNRGGSSQRNKGGSAAAIPSWGVGLFFNSESKPRPNPGSGAQVPRYILAASRTLSLRTSPDIASR